MSKYKALTVPITRREACLILDRRRFDGAVRSGDIEVLGKQGTDGVVPVADGARTAPLLFSQSQVRKLAADTSKALAAEASELRMSAKAIGKMTPPLTRRQIANVIGAKQTGILIRGGALTPYGTLTDTQTAAHTYDPADVATVVKGLADELTAESRSLRQSAKARVPA